MAINTDLMLRHQVIYSVFVRGHTKEGTFRALEGDLDRLKGLGADILWLMPIHPIGEEGRKGTMGSPYAIRDYRAVNPDMGTVEDLRHLVDAIHDRGMKCIIDVVYNHTSPDSVLAQTHPEFFLRDAAGKPTRKVADWWDIVDLDYTNRDLWRYQIDTLKQWAAIVDGFRCDVASAVPLDFWRQARDEVETVRHGCIWLAESVHGAHVLAMRKSGAYCATDTELQTVFDMTYDYDIWPCYEGVLTGKTSLREYADLLNYQPESTFDIVFSSGVLQYIPPAERRRVLEGYKAHTAVGGIHVLNVFVDKPFLPVPPDWEEEEAFWSSGELLSCYADWKVEQLEERIFDCDSSGIPHQHCMDVLIARKMV